MFLVAMFAFAALFTQEVIAQPKNAVDKAEAKAKAEALMNTRLQMLKDELQLTDAQYTEFEPIQIEKLYRIEDRIAREAKKIVQYK